MRYLRTSSPGCPPGIAPGNAPGIAPGIALGCQVFLIGFLAFLTGCSTYKPPSIQLVQVSLAERSPEAAAFHFMLEIQNDNSEPIELREFRYRLDLNGQEIFTGRREVGTTLLAQSTKRIALPGVVRFEAAGWTAQAFPQVVNYRLSGTLLYVTPGELAEILLDTGVRRPEVHFVSTGNLELGQPPVR